MGSPILFDVWGFFSMCEKGRVGHLIATSRSSERRSTGPSFDPPHPHVKMGQTQGVRFSHGASLCQALIMCCYLPQHSTRLVQKSCIRISSVEPLDSL